SVPDTQGFVEGRTVGTVPGMEKIQPQEPRIVTHFPQSEDMPDFMRHYPWQPTGPSPQGMVGAVHVDDDPALGRVGRSVGVILFVQENHLDPAGRGVFEKSGEPGMAFLGQRDEVGEAVLLGGVYARVEMLRFPRNTRNTRSQAPCLGKA